MEFIRHGVMRITSLCSATEERTTLFSTEGASTSLCHPCRLKPPSKIQVSKSSSQNSQPNQLVNGYISRLARVFSIESRLRLYSLGANGSCIDSAIRIIKFSDPSRIVDAGWSITSVM